MSLPQRKKTAEEIAKLRESLGIGGIPATAPPSAESAPVTKSSPSPVAVEPVVEKVPAPPVVAEVSPTKVSSPPATVSPPVSLDETHEPKVVRSLKRSERVPVLAVDLNGPPPNSVVLSEPQPIPAAVSPAAAHAPKMVRSLRKSEQGPLSAAHTPSADSSLPIHRHSDKELGEIRRREMLTHTMTAAPPPVLSAHPVLYAPGYLLVLGSAVGIYFYDVAVWVPAVCVALAFCIATFIFVKKTLSRHHAAFIAVIALFVIVFGALHYFPQLQHGT